MPDFLWEPWKFKNSPKKWYREPAYVSSYLGGLLEKNVREFPTFQDFYAIPAKNVDRNLLKEFHGFPSLLKVI